MTTLEILLEVKTRINKKEQYRWWRKRGWGNKYHAYSNMTRIRKACEKPNVVYSFHSICKNGKITGFPPPVFRTADGFYSCLECLRILKSRGAITETELWIYEKLRAINV